MKFVVLAACLSQLAAASSSVPLDLKFLALSSMDEDDAAQADQDDAASGAVSMA